MVASHTVNPNQAFLLMAFVDIKLQNALTLIYSFVRRKAIGFCYPDPGIPARDHSPLHDIGANKYVYTIIISELYWVLNQHKSFSFTNNIVYYKGK